MTDPAATSLHPAFGLLVTGVLVALWVWRRWNLRRALQVFSLLLFAAASWLAAFDGRARWPVDLFLFTDPLVALVHTIAGRAVVGLLLVSLAFVALAAVMGRVFCSHACPLGTLLDVTDHWVSRRARDDGNRARYRRLRPMKYVLLVVMVGAAGFGANLLGYADPLSLFTRFAATLFHPLLLLMQHLGLRAAAPVAASLDWTSVRHLEVPLRVFEGAAGTVALLVAVVALSRMQARFWCRHLCPLGALLAWCGRWALYRRRVAGSCDACQACARTCPMGAIDPETAQSDRSECIVCLSCVRTCSHSATSFGFGQDPPAAETRGVDLGRRGLLGGAIGGVAVGLTLRADVLLAAEPAARRKPSLIRPPGALPEPEFLSRCIRCGECLKACPTNTLQPDWYRAGIEGLWAPHLDFRHAPCQQDCNVCGQVCPTEAIRPLELEEKLHARLGTAEVLRDRCLPWANDEDCYVCEEQCPYAAVRLLHEEGHRAHVPFVDPGKCNGCGQCEDKCPVVGDSAIVVEPRGQIRLATGSYVEHARAQGLEFVSKRHPGTGRFGFGGDRLPPGLR